MEKAEELELFLEKADELIETKYIFADVKIAGLLKAVACSDVLVCMMENCLKSFDYEKVFASAFIKSDDDAHGEYVRPEGTKEMLALVFSVLVKIDNKTLDLAALMKDYFYADGSLFNSFTMFTGEFVKPYKTAVKLLFENIMGGKIKSASGGIKHASEVTARRLPEELAVDNAAARAAAVLAEEDRAKFLSSGLPDETVADALTLLGGIASALEAGDKAAVKVAFTGYYYFAAEYKKLLLNAERLRVTLKNGKFL